MPFSGLLLNQEGVIGSASTGRNPSPKWNPSKLMVGGRELTWGRDFPRFVERIGREIGAVSSLERPTVDFAMGDFEI